MGGRIPQSFIDELLARVDVVDVIDARVPVKKKGKDYMACCPFHGEKTPSFSVSREKQFYYCFGCGASGSALSFLMDYEHMGFVEAIEALAGMVGMEVPREEGDDDRPRINYDPLYQAMDDASQFYREQLRQHPQASRAIDYLKGRGLSGEIVTAFGIGFAPPGWDNLIRHVGDDPARQQALATTGMVIEKDGDKRYDRFRDRIMIPILDKRGRCIAFGGRVLGSDDQGAKYLNSPETPIFHKGRELYGLYQARKALRDIPRLLVVEGYMDVIALAQFGVRYAVATLGTATTTEHLEQLFRTSDEVVFCFDGDRAGRAAAERAMKNALPVIREGREAKFLFLPDGEDPDSLIRREGQINFEARVTNAQPLSQFLLENLAAQADIHTVDGRARLLELARPLFGKFNPGIYRDLITDQLAKLAEMDPARLAGHLYNAETGKTGDSAPVPRKATHVAARHPHNSLLGRVIKCLLHRPSLASCVAEPAKLLETAEPGVDILVDMLQLLQQNAELNTAAIVEHWRGKPAAARLAELAGEAPILAELGEQAMQHEFIAMLEKLRQQAEKRRIEEKLAAIANKPHAELTEEEKNMYRSQKVVGSGSDHKVN